MTQTVIRLAGQPQRRALLAAVLLLLGACAGAGGEFAFTAPPPWPIAAAPAPAYPGAYPGAYLAENAFIADDGAQLPLRHWLPAGPVRAVILALHGFGDYSHAFEAPAALWARQGIATYAYDQRGFGGAPGRGRWAGEARLVRDAVEASRLLRARFPGRPLYLLGESMGGAVAVMAMAQPTPAAVDGAILAAPAVWGRDTMGLLPRLALFFAARLFPDMTLTGSGLGIVASDNIAMLRALARDPMMLREAHVAMVDGLVDLMDDALAAAPRLKAPLLLLYGAHDEIIPRQPITQFAAQLPYAQYGTQRLAFYRRGYHMLLRDLEGAAVARDVASWVFDRTSPLPSQADTAAAARPWPPALAGAG